MYGLCRRMLRDHDLADEAAQEAFVKAFFALKQYDSSYRFYTWLSRIAFNLCCDALKERKRTVSAAKIQIGRSGRTILQEAIQLHGGMGVSNELAAGHYAKRLAMVAATLGDVEHHTERFASAGEFVGALAG